MRGKFMRHPIWLRAKAFYRGDWKSSIVFLSYSKYNSKDGTHEKKSLLYACHILFSGYGFLFVNRNIISSVRRAFYLSDYDDRKYFPGAFFCLWNPFRDVFWWVSLYTWSDSISERPQNWKLISYKLNTEAWRCVLPPVSASPPMVFRKYLRNYIMQEGRTHVDPFMENILFKMRLLFFQKIANLF